MGLLNITRPDLLLKVIIKLKAWIILKHLALWSSQPQLDLFLVLLFNEMAYQITWCSQRFLEWWFGRNCIHGAGSRFYLHYSSSLCVQIDQSFIWLKTKSVSLVYKVEFLSFSLGFSQLKVKYIYVFLRKFFYDCYYLGLCGCYYNNWQQHWCGES